MANKEATARIKINKLSEASGWRFVEKKIQVTLVRIWGEDEETAEPVILQ